MSEIYENAVEAEAASGGYNCVELYAPGRGVMNKLVIKQISGASEGFTARLYNRKGACANEAEQSSSPEDDTIPVDSDLHLVLSEISVSAGSVTSAQYQLTAGYQNQDESGILKTPKTRLYLDIQPGGSGNKLFQVAYAIEPAELS